MILFSKTRKDKIEPKIEKIKIVDRKPLGVKIGAKPLNTNLSILIPDYPCSYSCSNSKNNTFPLSLLDVVINERLIKSFEKCHRRDRVYIVRLEKKKDNSVGSNLREKFN